MSAETDEKVDSLGLPAAPEEEFSLPIGPRGGELMKDSLPPEEVETKQEEVKPEAAPVPSEQQVAAPPAPPQQPDMASYVMPIIQQQAQTNQALQQMAYLWQQQQAEAMRPPPEPEPDPIEDPKRFHEHMFQQQMGPIIQQFQSLQQQQLYQAADKKRVDMLQRHKDFDKYAPAVYEQAKYVPLTELAKEGTWEYIFRATRDFIRENQDQLVDEPEKKASPQRWPEAKQAPPTTPTGTMAGPAKQRMSEKFIQECRRMGNKPEDVLAFAIKDGIDPEELMK